MNPDIKKLTEDIKTWAKAPHLSPYLGQMLKRAESALTLLSKKLEEVEERQEARDVTTAKNAQAFGWVCKDFADGWIFYGPGQERSMQEYVRQTGCLHHTVYLEPPLHPRVGIRAGMDNGVMLSAREIKTLAEVSGMEVSGEDEGDCVVLWVGNTHEEDPMGEGEVKYGLHAYDIECQEEGNVLIRELPAPEPLVSRDGLTDKALVDLWKSLGGYLQETSPEVGFMEKDRLVPLLRRLCAVDNQPQPKVKFVWDDGAHNKLRVAVDVDYAFDFSRSMLKSAASLVQMHQHMTCPHCRCDVKVSLPLTVHSRDVDRLAQIMGSVYQVAANRGITTNFLSDIKTNIQVSQLAKIKTS